MNNAKSDFFAQLKTISDIDEACLDKFNGVTAKEIHMLEEIGDRPIQLTKLAQKRGITQQAMGKNCNLLKRKGLVVIEPDRSDKRAKKVSISPRGRVVLEEFESVLREFG